MQIFARFGSWSVLIGTAAAPQLRNRAFLLPCDGPAPKIVSLVEIGFFQPRGARENWTYWVPFLYRDALNMSQGIADEVD